MGLLYWWDWSCLEAKTDDPSSRDLAAGRYDLPYTGFWQQVIYPTRAVS